MLDLPAPVPELVVRKETNVPTVWSVLMIAAKKIAAERGRQPRFDDGVTSGRTTCPPRVS